MAAEALLVRTGVAGAAGPEAAFEASADGPLALFFGNAASPFAFLSRLAHFPAGTAVFGILLEVEARGSARPRAGESIYDFDAAFLARAESPGAWGAALGDGDHRLQEADNGD